MGVHTRVLDGRRDLLAPAASFPDRYPCLLESAARGGVNARWDMLLAFPQAHIDSRDGVGFLDALDAAWREQGGERIDDGLPFHGGWALFLAYELAGAIEPSLMLPPTPAPLPAAQALRCPAAILVDHQQDRTVLVAEPGHEALLDAMQADLQLPLELPALARPDAVDEESPQCYLDAVERVHHYLRSGDTFQANISRWWRADYAQPPTPAALHAALRHANPAPFAALWQQPGWAVVSSSPERLVQVQGRHVQTRPIAGTRPRRLGEDDRTRVAELVGHPKERAEHVMLIDLERNDLGRVCEPGSVRVDELMTVESYAHVHHIVSNVSGRLRAGVTPGQVVAATFPGGTITGCPKVRCMQIIAELEGEGRGAYTGAIGFLDRSGDMDLNILIRTLTAVAGQVHWRAGAGIVVDSDAVHELDETRAKARGLLHALGVDA